MKLRLYYPVLLFVFLLSTNLFSQENIHQQQNYGCGTTLADDSDPSLQRQLDERWQTERDYYLNLVRNIQNNLSKNIANVRMVPVQLHIIRATDGSGGISVADLEDGLALTNEYLIKGGVYLYQ